MSSIAKGQTTPTKCSGRQLVNTNTVQTGYITVTNTCAVCRYLCPDYNVQ